PLHVPSYSTTAVDTTAAGETFAGVLSLSLGQGRPVREAVQRAAAAAAVSVGRPGASSSMQSEGEIDEFVAAQNSCNSSPEVGRRLPWRGRNSRHLGAEFTVVRRVRCE